MSRLDNNPDLAVGMSAVTARMNTGETQHWKYPETVGNDTIYDDINFNSDETSEYAVARMSHISTATHEPFMLFEFMKVDNDDYGTGTANAISGTAGAFANSWKDQAANGVTGGNHVLSEGNVVRNYFSSNSNRVQIEGTPMSRNETADEKISRIATDLKGGIVKWAKSIGNLVKRKYTGSIALYMPNDIQINDQMVYNEDSRKMGALAETLFSENYEDAFNPTTLTSQAALTTIGFLGGKIAGKIPFIGSKGSGVFSALAGAGLAELAGNEIQRGSGKIANPNEILMYQSTAMRTFSFSWTILPDSLDESKQAAGLIKMFRMSAHARKDNLMIVTVPDHVIVSFHGAKDMIQLPPCVIESVNVTYNPNSSSFFKENNAPVEIGLVISLKEMAPIYAGDVDKGY
tara:strand:+ start:42 stop:1253 length:1212 start_codon:yes stop_codon:yes gene_type:complete